MALGYSAPRDKTKIVVITLERRFIGIMYTPFQARPIDHLNSGLKYIVLTNVEVYSRFSNELLDTLEFIVLKNKCIELVYLMGGEKDERKYIRSYIKKGRLPVAIFTSDLKIECDFHVLFSARFSDEVNNTNEYIPISNAKLSTYSDGKEEYIFSVDFMIIRSDIIRYMHPIQTEEEEEEHHKPLTSFLFDIYYYKTDRILESLTKMKYELEEAVIKAQKESVPQTHELLDFATSYVDRATGYENLFSTLQAPPSCCGTNQQNISKIISDFKDVFLFIKDGIAKDLPVKVEEGFKSLDQLEERLSRIQRAFKFEI